MCGVGHLHQRPRQGCPVLGSRKSGWKSAIRGCGICHLPTFPPSPPCSGCSAPGRGSRLLESNTKSETHEKFRENPQKSAFSFGLDSGPKPALATATAPDNSLVPTSRTPTIPASLAPQSATKPHTPKVQELPPRAAGATATIAFEHTRKTPKTASRQHRRGADATATVAPQPRFTRRELPKLPPRTHFRN